MKSDLQSEKRRRRKPNDYVDPADRDDWEKEEEQPNPQSFGNRVLKVMKRSTKIGEQWEVQMSCANSGMETWTMKSYDKPLDSLPKSLSSLRPIVLNLLGLPEDYGNQLNPYGVKVRWDTENPDLGYFVISVEKIVIGDFVWSFDTPESAFTETAYDALLEVLDEAEKYLTGQRQILQPSLFDDDTVTVQAADITNTAATKMLRRFKNQGTTLSVH